MSTTDPASPTGDPAGLAADPVIPADPVAAEPVAAEPGLEPADAGRPGPWYTSTPFKTALGGLFALRLGRGLLGRVRVHRRRKAVKELRAEQRARKRQERPRAAARERGRGRRRA